VKGVIEIPEGKKIKLNGYGISGYGISGYTFIEDKIAPTCDGKEVMIDGKKYVLKSVD
jgi:hypothetical protein